MSDLAIKDVAERTGIATGTIRMWEQRYGFPDPGRTPSGYRRYTEEDVALLRRVLAYRETGLSVAAALERARARVEPTDSPSIFGAIASAPGAPVTPQRLRKRTLVSISRAIEDEAMARGAGPVVFGAFQRRRHYEPVEHRYQRLARAADATVVFATDFDGIERPADGPVKVPISEEATVGNEWAVIIDAPGYAACLLAWEPPRTERELQRLPDADRRFETLWTMDPQVVRRAALVAGSLAGRADAELGERLDGMLRDRPLAVDSPAPALTALCNRMISYLEA